MSDAGPIAAFALIAGPVAHHGDRAVEVGDEEMADRELRRAEAGQELQRVERQVEMLQAIERDEFGKRDRREAVADARR